MSHAIPYILAALVTVTLLCAAQRRLLLSRAKHRSLAGHARIARRIASLVPFYEYEERRFFRVDGAPEEIATQRREGFMRLAVLFGRRYSKTAALTREVQESISDLQF